MYFFSRRFSSFALIATTLFVASCSQDSAYIHVPANATSGEHVHEILRYGIKNQQCEAEKIQYLETHKKALIDHVDTLFRDVPELKPNASQMGQKLKWFQNEKIEVLGDELSVLLKSNASEVGSSLQQLVGDVPFTTFSEPRLWRVVEIAQRDEWSKLEKNIREGLANIGSHEEEFKEAQAIAGRLKALAESEDGRTILKPLQDAFDLPNIDNMWQILTFARRDELPVVARNMQAEVDRFVAGDTELLELLSVLVRLRDFALTDDGRFLLSTLAKDTTEFSDETLHKTLHFVQKPEVVGLAYRFSDASQKLQTPNEHSAAILRGIASTISTDDLWPFVVLLQRKELESIALASKHFSIEEGTKVVFERAKALATTDDIRDSARTLARVFADSEVPVADHIFKVVTWLKTPENRALLKDAYETFSNPKFKAALQRVADFSLSKKGETSMAYLKKFFTDKKTRQFLIKLFEYGKSHHGWFYENTGLTMCLGDSWYSSRSACVFWMTMGKNGFDEKLLNEAFDIGTIAYKEGILADLLTLANTVETFTTANKQAASLYAGAGDNLAQKIDTFLSDQAQQKAIVSMHELLFEKGLGKELSTLEQHRRNLATKYRFEVKEALALLSDYQDVLLSISKEQIEQILALASDPAVNQLPQLLQDYRADFELLLELSREFELHPKQITQERVNQFVAYVKQADHVRAAGILQGLAQQKDAQKNAVRFYELVRNFMKKHETDSSMLQALNEDFGIPLKDVSVEHIKRLRAFLLNEDNQEAARALFRVAMESSLAQDLLRLNQMAMSLLQARQSDLELLWSLKEFMGLTLDRVSKDDFEGFVRYITDPKNQEASQKLLSFAYQLVIFGHGAHETLAPARVEENTESQKTNRIQAAFSVVKEIKREDVRAVLALSRMSYDLWSMTEANLCQRSTQTHIHAGDVEGVMMRFSEFLSDPDHGLRSWLSLFRRVAKDRA